MQDDAQEYSKITIITEDSKGISTIVFQKVANFNFQGNTRPGWPSTPEDVEISFVAHSDENDHHRTMSYKEREKIDEEE